MPEPAPLTRYAKTADGVHIGYQVLGDGPTDLVFVPYEFSNIEASWDIDYFARFVRALARDARVLLLDRRGTGTSDRGTIDVSPTIEARMDDIRAVMDAVGSTRACLFGVESGGTLCLVFAATYPDRTAGVIVFGGSAAGRWSPEYPWAWTDDEWDEWDRRIEHEWGSPDFVRELSGWLSPSLAGDEEYLRVIGRLLRLSASPGEALARDRVERDTDIRGVLGSIQVPTMLLHRTRDRVEPVEQARYIAQHVPGSSLVELDGEDHIWPMDDIVPHVGRFMRSIRDEEAEFDRVLATVLFTDIVGSTEKAAGLGDRAWKTLLERHHMIVRALLGRYRGTEIDTAGDGFFATFEGPARAIRCAQEIVAAVEQLGLQIRAGVHTGEVETIDDKIGGLGVVIGARVGGIAGPSEVLASQTVRDLTAGSGLVFEDTGERELKGVPGRWRIFRVSSALAAPILES